MAVAIAVCHLAGYQSGPAFAAQVILALAFVRAADDLPSTG